MPSGSDERPQFALLLSLDLARDYVRYVSPWLNPSMHSLRSILRTPRGTCCEQAVTLAARGALPSHWGASRLADLSRSVKNYLLQWPPRQRRGHYSRRSGTPTWWRSLQADRRFAIPTCTWYMRSLRRKLLTGCALPEGRYGKRRGPWLPWTTIFQPSR